MAWDFAAEIHALSNFDADLEGTTGSTSGENLSLHVNQWLTDGAKEVVNQLPSNLQRRCAVFQSFTSAAAGSEAETIGEGNILSVFNLSNNVSCRSISNSDKYKAADSGNPIYATATDPVYYFEADKINVLPASLSCKYEEVQYPAVTFDDTSISNFPDEAEYLVVLYAASKACLHQLNTLQTDATIDTTALTAIKTALDRVAAYNWGDADTFTTGTAQLTRVKNALDRASDLINGNAPSATTDAYGAQANEDVEIVSSALSIASTELNRASTHLNEWSTISGVAVQEAQGFIAEANTRVQRATQKYSWYDAQYAKLTGEYARGLAALKGG